VDGPDELLQITGIGRARARWLAEHGIRTLRDLAAVSPEFIAEQLRAEGRVLVSHGAIESWVTQARELVAQGEREGEESLGGVPDEVPAQAGTNVESEWKPLASFVVELQSSPGAEARGPWRTSVHHLEKDAGEDWPGFDCERLCEWLTASLGDQLPPDALGARPDLTDAEPAEAAEDFVEEGRPLPVVPREEGRGPTLHLEAAIIDSDGVEGAHRLRIDRGWAVGVRWSVAEEEPPDLAGVWQVQVSFTPIGPGEPLQVQPEPARQPVEPRADHRYGVTVHVPVGVVTSAHCGVPYDGLVVLTHEPAGGGHGSWASFPELGPVQFYDPGQ